MSKNLCLRIPNEAYRAMKKLADERHVTLTEVVIQAFSEHLNRTQEVDLAAHVDARFETLASWFFGEVGEVDGVYKSPFLKSHNQEGAAK